MGIHSWFSQDLEIHPTDQYIHWTMKNKERVKTAEKFRAAYDKIVAAGMKEELDILTKAAYDQGGHDEWEQHCGPEL